MGFKYVRVCDQCGVVISEYERVTIGNNDYCKECASYHRPAESLSMYSENIKPDFENNIP